VRDERFAGRWRRRRSEQQRERLQRKRLGKLRRFGLERLGILERYGKLRRLR
jgi:hypothetical protein